MMNVWCIRNNAYSSISAYQLWGLNSTQNTDLTNSIGEFLEHIVSFWTLHITCQVMTFIKTLNIKSQKLVLLLLIHIMSPLTFVLYNHKNSKISRVLPFSRSEERPWCLVGIDYSKSSQGSLNTDLGGCRLMSVGTLLLPIGIIQPLPPNLSLAFS